MSRVIDADGRVQGLISEPMHEFSTGARRSALKPRYDLVPQAPLVRLAHRYEMGLKYGEDNWKRGLPFSDTLNHTLDHLLRHRERYKDLVRSFDEATARKELSEIHLHHDDDLAGAAWGCFALMCLEQEGGLILG